MQLARWIRRQAQAMHATAPYCPPTAGARAAAVAALRALLTTEEQPVLPRGLRLITGDDDGPYRGLTAGPWGTIIVRGTTPRLLVEVPHPRHDWLTEMLGHALFRAIPDAALLIAGTHRRAGNRAADVAHRTDSLFHAYAQALAVPEIQVHGFAETTAPGVDAVVSAGAGARGGLHTAAAAALTKLGLRVYDHRQLAGRANVQGIAAAEHGRPFVHLELAAVARNERQLEVVTALAGAWVRWSRGPRELACGTWWTP